MNAGPVPRPVSPPAIVSPPAVSPPAVSPPAVSPPAVSPPAVVVAGDAFIDLTTSRTARGTPCYEPHPGGSCLNVAVGLGRLRVPVTLLARVSDDEFGGLLRAHLAGSGVLNSYLIPTSDLTGLGVANVVDGQAGYSFHTAAAADRGLRPEHLTGLPGGGRLPDGAALHFGSIALLQEPQASTLDGLVRRESGRRLVSLDPNVRPSLVTDRPAYLARMVGWVAGSDLVKVSDEDLAWLYPGETYQSVAQRWLDSGVALVLVTLGADGAWASTTRARGRVGAVPVEVIDTVGAGDAFMAGGLAWLHRMDRLSRDGVSTLDAGALELLLRTATRVAADTCTRSGAQPPFWPDLSSEDLGTEDLSSEDLGTAPRRE